MARRRRRQFSSEFKAEAVRLVETSDAPIATIAQQLGMGKGTLCRWVEAARPAPQERLTEDERSELTRLRRENRQLQMEHAILKKATADSGRRCNAMSDRRDHAARATIADERKRQSSDLGSMDTRRIAE
jgi:transposase